MFQKAISSSADEYIDGTPLIPSTSHRNIYLATFAAQLFIVVMGMVAAYSSPACVDMVRPGSRLIHITPNEVTWIASLPMLSGMVGNALSGYISHQFGRKTVLMHVSALFTTSWLLIAYAPNVNFVYAGRILSGLSAGCCTVAVPAYVVEISTVKIRGFLAAGFQVAYALGVFIMTVFGIILRWSWLAILGAVVVVLGTYVLYFMPESPSWLIRNSRKDEAVRGIQFLKGKNHDIVNELKEIGEHLVDEPKDRLTFRRLMEPDLYKPLLIAFGLMFNQAFCGFPTIMSYTVEVFQSASSFIDANIAATIVAIVQVIATIISSLLMDRAGRKPLYIISGSCITLSLVALGIHGYFSQIYDASYLFHWTWVPLLSFIIYIFAFSLGFGPIPYVVIPELISTQYRSFVMAVGCISASFLGFVVTKSFDTLRSSIGIYGLYWLYGVFSLLGFLFYWIFVPETKGRTIHEINKTFSVSKNT